MSSREIGALPQQAALFSERLRDVRARLGAVPFDWYPYDSLTAFAHLNALLTAGNREILEQAGQSIVADIGCADGDLSFFLESLGMRVQAFDYAVTNHNSMRGVHLLRETLESAVDVHAVNIDREFRLPEESYPVAFLLGALYHLKNPFHVLETLSKQVKQLVISTRIASRTPDGQVSFQQEPLAYLVGATELNNDDSNYWIFSEAALRRVIERSHWEVLDWIAVGAEQSDPLHRDARVFALLRSRFGMSNVELGTGWYDAEEEGWRWTARVFAATARRSHPPLSRLSLKFYFPEALVAQWGSLTVSASVNGQPLPPETYRSAGNFEYLRGFPAANAATVRFELDHSLAPSESDWRELGIIAASLDFD